MFGEHAAGGGWRKSSRCGNGACVEVNTDDESVLIRDSKRPSSDPWISVSRGAWSDFVAGVKDGEFDHNQ